MAAKLVLALAMGATALLAPTNKLPVNTVRRAASAAPEMVVKVGVIGAGRIGPPRRGRQASKKSQ